AHGTANIEKQTNSSRLITKAVLELYDKIVDENLLIRRLNISANHIVSENNIESTQPAEQLDFFTDYDKKQQDEKDEEERLKKEHSIQEAMLDIKKKYGKNAILKGTSFKEGATGKDRNTQITLYEAETANCHQRFWVGCEWFHAAGNKLSCANRM
ncbi:MAG: hypothetical protein LIO62_05345, partial [Clostridiales bacterium]|nr:hypothetical protein [Clostridiales bacterium]